MPSRKLGLLRIGKQEVQDLLLVAVDHPGAFTSTMRFPAPLSSACGDGSATIRTKGPPEGDVRP